MGWGILRPWVLVWGLVSIPGLLLVSLSVCSRTLWTYVHPVCYAVCGGRDQQDPMGGHRVKGTLTPVPSLAAG